MKQKYPSREMCHSYSMCTHKSFDNSQAIVNVEHVPSICVSRRFNFIPRFAELSIPSLFFF